MHNIETKMHLKKFQKKLRLSQTDAENLLWFHLKDRRFYGFKFRRQHILQGYIVDFVCLERRLIIELDGGQHNEQQRFYDEQRTKTLNQENFEVIRFWNNDVLQNLKSVLEIIAEKLGNKNDDE